MIGGHAKALDSVGCRYLDKLKGEVLFDKERVVRLHHEMEAF